MRTTRRNFFGVLVAAAGLSRVKLDAARPSQSPAHLEPHITIGGRLVDFKDLVVTHTIGVECDSATFKTLSGIKVGAPATIELGTDVLFHGHVQQTTLHRGHYGPLFYEVICHNIKDDAHVRGILRRGQITTRVNFA
jgi:hypothetical protein